jgi:ABC-type Mn2+/Zn2+ transport system ATPase subunit
VLVALHDLTIARERFGQVMLLNRKLYGFGRPDDVLTPENLMAAYGGHLHLMRTESGLLALGDTCCDEGEHDA